MNSKLWLETYAVADFISVGILLTAIAMNGIQRLETCAKTYQLNSILLAMLIAVTAIITGERHLYAAAAITLLSKGILIPIFLKRIILWMKVTKDVEPHLSNVASLTISSLLVAVVYGSLSEGIFVTGIARSTLMISIAVILIGLFIMITRKKAITQIIGLLFMENGLFLAGFSLTFGMPIVIELGVLFDMLMGVIILGIFTIQIKRVFGKSNLDKLTVLKG